MDHSIVGIKEALILAGGFGTRLQSVVNEIPKPMAPVAGKPFLEFLLQYLEKQGIQRVVLSVGYKYEIIRDYFQDQYQSMEIIYAVEPEPLGTGGGIVHALQYTKEKTILLLNGDSFFNVDISTLVEFHFSVSADISFSLKEMSQVDRYGTLELEGNRITKFYEKKYIERGLINGGVYVVNTSIFNQYPLPVKFSFESDFLEKYLHKLILFGIEFDSYFIDIGIPDDYYRAQTELLII